MKKMTTFELCISAFFAALTAVLAQIAIPIGPVPITLGSFAVLLSGVLLGAKSGTVSQIVYVLLGAVGVPVFASFKAGVGVLAGPTGGYIAGYILAAWIAGFIAGRFGNKIYVLLLAAFAGYLVYTAAGTFWYMFSTGTGLSETLMVCVVPFLPGDAIKIVLAAALAHQLRPVLQNQYLAKSVKSAEK